jgi:3-methyladenine DNA glycosylase AlkD
VADLTAAAFVARLDAHRSDEERHKYRRYFPSSDDFIGVRMGTVFALAKEHVDMPVDEIEKLLESPAHEARAGAVSIMAKQAALKRTTDERRGQLYELYLRRHDRIDDWDLVDLGAWKVVGRYLQDRPRDILYDLAASPNRWERRTAVLSTLHFTMRGDVDDAFALAERLLDDDDDLVNKATGWALREGGRQDRARLLAFLDTHAATMPRTTLRAAVEHLDPAQRKHYLGLARSSRARPASG